MKITRTTYLFMALTKRLTCPAGKTWVLPMISEESGIPHIRIQGSTVMLAANVYIMDMIKMRLP